MVMNVKIGKIGYLCELCVSFVSFAVKFNHKGHKDYTKEPNGINAGACEYLTALALRN